jgi:hypothetical protein
LDAQDKLSAGPIELIIDPSLSANNPDNSAHTAGTTFVGQFVDHDITFDTSSPVGTPTDPLSAPNGRTPALDLDSLYGGGPSGRDGARSVPRMEPLKAAISGNLLRRRHQKRLLERRRLICLRRSTHCAMA